MIDLMDAIGWREQPEAPDEQPLGVPDDLARWAATQADDLAGDVLDDDPRVVDARLVALAALRRVAGAGAEVR
jgi:hypothetical protein